MRAKEMKSRAHHRRFALGFPKKKPAVWQKWRKDAAMCAEWGAARVSLPQGTQAGCTHPPAHSFVEPLEPQSVLAEMGDASAALRQRSPGNRGRQQEQCRTSGVP